MFFDFHYFNSFKMSFLNSGFDFSMKSKSFEIDLQINFIKDLLMNESKIIIGFQVTKDLPSDEQEEEEEDDVFGSDTEPLIIQSPSIKPTSSVELIKFKPLETSSILFIMNKND